VAAEEAGLETAASRDAGSETGMATEAPRRSRPQIRWRRPGTSIRIPSARTGRAGAWWARAWWSRTRKQASGPGRTRRRFPMIAHTVLFQPGPSVGPETKAAILESLRRAIGQCPTVRACRIGRRVRHGLPGYEQQMRADYQYLLILEFDDIEGLRAYLEHPAHDAIGGFFTSAASASLAYDYEMADLADAAHL
jgi:hypothetical protein